MYLSARTSTTIAQTTTTSPIQFQNIKEIDRLVVPAFLFQFHYVGYLYELVLSRVVIIDCACIALTIVRAADF